MIRHLFKLVWNRKKTNVFIVAEIFCSFLVIFSLATTVIYLYQRYRDPLGFDYRDVWRIDVTRNTPDEWAGWSEAEAETFARLVQELERMDEVEVAAGASTAPYTNSNTFTGWEYQKRQIRAEVAYVTPRFNEVLGLELVSGRWLRPEDSAVEWIPIVVDQDLAFELVGEDDPVGRRVGDEPEDDFRVVGVVREFRRAGEFEENGPYVFKPVDAGTEDPRPLRDILIKVAPGTRADFEEPLVKMLRSLARGWSFNVIQIETARETYIREKLVPLAAIGVVAGFLLIMVVLGLTGVMWQNVTRRTREIGLRRATGAHRGRIQRQIVGEVLVTAALGLIVGTVLAIQVPVVGPFTFVPFAVVLPALLSSAVLILVLAALCGLYPGWSATRIHPAEALHYE